MPTSGTGPYWYVTLPVERVNTISNPSFEFGTSGWAGTGSGPTLGSVANFQAFGAYSLSVTGASDGIGATATAASIGSGSAVIASAYVQIRGATGGSVQIGVGGTTFRTAVGSVWQRVSVGTINTAAAARTIAIQRFNANSGTLYVDGVQVEGGGSITTYIDGDQDGCQWLGAAHTSISLRSGQSRAGGSVVALRDLGLVVEEAAGHGAPPLVTVQQPYALLDGSEYQRTKVAARSFSLVGAIVGTTTADWHLTRRRLIDALKVDAVAVPQPIRLLYTGAGGTTYLDAVWDGGLEIAEQNGPMSEPAAVVRFAALDPYFRGDTQRGTAFAPYRTLGSVNFVAYRDPAGLWGVMTSNGTSIVAPTFGSAVTCMAIGNPGTVFVGGNIFNPGGTATQRMAQWTNGAWGSLAGGTLDAGVGADYDGTPLSIRYSAATGTLFVGGLFNNAAGTGNIRGFAYWGGASWGSATNGNTSRSGGGVVYSVNIDVDGAVIVGGLFDQAGGTAGTAIARWNGAWGTFNGQLRASVGLTAVFQVSRIGDAIYAAGFFGSANGTLANNLAVYRNGAWGTLRSALNDQVNVVRAAQDNSLYLGGEFTNAGTGLARVTGFSFAGAGSISIDSAYGINTLAVLPDGNVWAGGSITAINGPVPVTPGLALYNGYSWLPSDIRIPGDGRVAAIERDASGTLYIGGQFFGPGTAASVTTVTNPASAICFPTLRIRNTGSGTARIYQLLNTTTGDGIWFNYVMSPGERAELVLDPSGRTFTSTARGTILSTILPGSNLASWKLLPGTNTVSFFADSPTVEASMFWDTRHWSADGVTE